MSERMSWSDGWQEVTEGFRIYIEGGEILRGVEGGRTVYPYRHAKRDGYDREYHAKANKRTFDRLAWF